MILFKQWGGACVGGWRGTWPFGRLIVEPSRITVSLLSRRKSFSPGHVTATRLLYGGTFGLEVIHRAPHGEESAAFYANLRLKKLLPALIGGGIREVQGAD
jgi:hypothetical protein